MIESQQVLEWMAMGEAKGRAEGRAEGEVEGEIKAFLWVLAIRFPPGAPPDLEAALRAAKNREYLGDWLDVALKAESLDAFRQAIGS